MKDISLINIEQFKEAVKELNNSGLLEKKVKVVGISKEDMIKAFAYAVEHIPEEKKKKLPKLAKAMYNDIFSDEAVKPEKAPAKKAPAKKAEKPEKPVKEKKSDKVLVKVNAWGAKEGNQTYIIDGMLMKGGHTLEEMARGAATTLKRVSTHNQARKQKATIVREGKKYYVKES